MILEFILDAMYWCLQHGLGNLIVLPSVPEDILANVYGFIDMIFDNLGLVGFFVRWETITVCVPLVIAVANLDKIYDGVMWVIRKIPMAGMS